MLIRPIKSNEIMLLTDFIYEAIHQPDMSDRIPRTIIQDPSIWIHIDGFGTKADDHCLVALVDDLIVGAVWVRCINAFGHIDDSIPEFAISVYPHYRGKGIGTRLMQEMMKLLRIKGYSKASLAVQKDNAAVTLYQHVGFEVMGENEQEYIMTIDLN